MVLIIGFMVDGNVVNVSVSFSVDFGCSVIVNVLFIVLVVCFLVNDDCVNVVIFMVMEDGMCFNIVGINFGVIVLGEFLNLFCGSFGFGEDVWYEVIVLVIGELIIEMSFVGGFIDWIM